LALDNPDVLPAMASSSVPVVDNLWRSMQRARSKQRSIGALIAVVNSMTGICEFVYEKFPR